MDIRYVAEGEREGEGGVGVGVGVGVRVNEVGRWWMDAQRSTDTVTQRFKSTDLDRGRYIT